jgi:hypothetical protein
MKKEIKDMTEKEIFEELQQLDPQFTQDSLEYKNFKLKKFEEVEIKKLSDLDFFKATNLKSDYYYETIIYRNDFFQVIKIDEINGRNLTGNKHKTLTKWKINYRIPQNKKIVRKLVELDISLLGLNSENKKINTLHIAKINLDLKENKYLKIYLDEDNILNMNQDSFDMLADIKSIEVIKKSKFNEIKQVMGEIIDEIETNENIVGHHQIYGNYDMEEYFHYTQEILIEMIEIIEAIKVSPLHKKIKESKQKVIEALKDLHKEHEF